TSRGEADGVRDQYQRVLDEIRRRELPAEISVKLTHLGLELDPRACLQHLLALATRAADARSFLWIDMEESRYVDATLELARAVFGTHDLGLIARLRDRALGLGLTGGGGAGGYEVHMLYGIRSAAQRALALEGVAVRVLISYGTHWFPWYMRRLAERPANVWFVVRHLLG